jgi:hypothetical protein
LYIEQAAQKVMRDHKRYKVMSNLRDQKTNPSQTMIYQIRLKGHLDSQWTEWFDGLTVTLEEDGNTLLTGPVIDQAALHGLLKKVRDLGIPLLSVSQVQFNETHPYRSKKEIKMNANRTNALSAGILFVIADIAGFLSVPLLKLVYNPDYLIKIAENKNQVVMAALLIVIMELACSGIAIWLYPVLKKHNEALALWSVGLRIIEVILGLVSVIGLLALIPLSQEFIKAGAPDASYFQTLGALIQTARDWTRDVLMLSAWGLGALLYNYIFFQTKLIPRWLSGSSIVAILLHLASCLLTIFDIIGPSSPMQVFLLVPSGLLEMVLAVWLIAKGFNPSAIASLSAKVDMS